tara:strand:- start:14695 stop:16032 length:1338 start_codon:yes stop_codon:yes gene_type:complete
MNTPENGFAEDVSSLFKDTIVEVEEADNKTIFTGSNEQTDIKIKNRLQQIFKEIDALQNVDVHVSAGIVQLQGQVNSVSAETRAVQFSYNVEGVVEVENNLRVNHKISPRLEDTGKRVTLLGQSIVAALPLLLLALITFLLFLFLGRWIGSRDVFYRRVTPNYFIANLLAQLTRLAFVVIGLMIALLLMDAQSLIGTILGAVGLIGLAIGFAVRDTVENYIASILLSIRNPFDINDLVIIDGFEGNVVKLNSRATILISPDGNHIRVPNAKVFKAVITNFTRHPERRFEFDVGIDTEQDVLLAQALALEALTEMEGVLVDPKPSVIVHQLGDSNIILRIYAWVDQKHFSFLKVRSEAIRLVKQVFDDADIVMPEPIYKLRMVSSESLPINNFEAPKQQPTPSRNSYRPPVEQDVRADHVIEDKVVEQRAVDVEENLLSPDAPKEL